MKRNELTLTTVIENNSHMPSRLIHAIVKNHGGWNEFKELAEDICNYGANTGISFIYYKDQIAFVKKYRKEILSFIENESEEIGLSVGKFVLGFRCLPGCDFTETDVYRVLLETTRSKSEEDLSQIYAALSWYVVEELAYMILELSCQ